MSNQKWTIQRNWQHKERKKKKIAKEKHNSIYTGHQCANKHKKRKQDMSPPTNTEGKEEPHIVFYAQIVTDITTLNSERKDKLRWYLQIKNKQILQSQQYYKVKNTTKSTILQSQQLLIVIKISTQGSPVYHTERLHATITTKYHLENKHENLTNSDKELKLA
jgi:hypothetical protein